MSRIRSIHPGFFTDENIVSVSMAARMLIIGLGVEADDKGIFEWKPLQIKMKVFPADNIDVVALLTELLAQDIIRKFDVAGKQYGAIRNFRKYQRPKTPNSIHPITPEIENYVCLSAPKSDETISAAPTFPQDREVSAVEAPSFPPKGEKPLLMEDGGDNMEEIEGKRISKDIPKATPADPDLETAFADFLALAKELDLPNPQRLTDPRRRALKARLAECGGLDGWAIALSKIRGSPFLRGINRDGWKADLDFVLQAKSFTKLMEGAYDGNKRNGNNPNNPTQPRSLVAEALAV